MAPAYSWMDKVVQYRAWNPEFYATIQRLYPEEYEGVDFKEAFYKWQNAFEASWPSLLIEPDSEKAKTEKIKLEGMISILQVLLPTMDPENKAKLVEWAQDNFNSITLLFPFPLDLDLEALAEFVPQNLMGGDEGDEEEGEKDLPEPKPMGVGRKSGPALRNARP